MAIDMNALEEFVPFFVPFTTRAQYRHLVSGGKQCGRLFPHAPIEGHGKVLYDDQDLSFHRDLSCIQSDPYNPASAHSIVACPQCKVGVLLTSHPE